MRGAEITEEHFRVAIFGSARIQQDDTTYQQIYELARLIGQEGLDIITGGGPGIMEAANKGHDAGDPRDESHSLGLLIKLPNEQRANAHLEIKEEFSELSNRLDSFMQLSNAVIVAPGGIGTFLELMYTWQLIQVNFIAEMPIVLVGDMWQELVDWVRRWQLDTGYIAEEDLNFIFTVNTIEEAMAIIREAVTLHESGETDICGQLSKHHSC